MLVDTFPHCLNKAHNGAEREKSIIVTKIVVEHRDGHEPDEGMLKIVKKLWAGKWDTDIKTKNPWRSQINLVKLCCVMDAISLVSI